MKSSYHKYLALYQGAFLGLVSLFFVARVWGQAYPLPARYQLTLDAKGNIPSDFWSYQIPIKPVTQAIPFIKMPVDLLEQEPLAIEETDENPDSPQLRKDKKVVADVIRALERGGAALGEDPHFGPPERCVSQFNVSPLGETGLYLWRVGIRSFLVDESKSSWAAPLSFGSGDDDWDKAIVSTQVEVLSPSVYRIFCDLSAAANGCGAGMAQWLSVFDVDRAQGTWVRCDLPGISWSVDLDQDKHIEVVTSAGVDDMVFFPWVYAWNGTKWVDRRARFWNCYRDGKLEPLAFCGGRLLKTPAALAKAIKAGEPLKYWKAIERGEEKVGE